MDWFNKINRIRILIALTLVILLSSCYTTPGKKLWVKSEGWSRPIKIVKTTLAASPPSVIDQSGKLYFLLFPKVDNEAILSQMELVILDEFGELNSRKIIDLQIPIPSDAEIIFSGGDLDLFWVDSYRLKTARINLEGELLSDVLVLSGDERVNEFSIIYRNGSYLISFGGDRENPGAFILTGELTDLKKTNFDPDGIRINQYLDEAGRLHLSWIRYSYSYGDFEFYYLETDPDNIKLNEQTPIFIKKVSPSVRIIGPVLGFDNEVGYLFWSEAILAGLEAGSRTSFLQYFPLGRPDQIRPPMRMMVPASQNLESEEYISGYFSTGNRVPAGGIRSGSSYQDHIVVIPGNFSELVIAFRSRSEHKWRDFRNQVNVAYLSDGLVTTYQPISYTSTDSSHPNIFQDEDQNLYLSWLERDQSTYYVYFSTTEAAKRTSLDLVSSNDYFPLAAEGIFGILAGAILFPFAAAIWGGAGLLAFIFNLILSQFHKPIFRTVGEILSIVGALYIFWWMKFATLPGLDDGYVPFSAWIPRVPSVMEKPLIIGIPILIGVISATVAWTRTYGKQSGSPINFHLIYSAMDALLSCAVYGILIYGAF
jgi:hypothetical protein